MVEFGSGKSTIAIAAAIRAAGGGSLATIEHDSHFANTMQKRIVEARLKDFVDLRVVQMRKYEPRFGLAEHESYDLTSLDVDFDVALIDGPPVSQFGVATRSVPLDWCVARLDGDRVVYLDDAARDAEQKAIQCSKYDLSDFNVEMIDTEKGLLRLRRLSTLSKKMPVI